MRTKKVILIYLLLFIITNGYLLCQDSLSMSVRYVDFNIMTPYRISCDNFDEHFSKEKVEAFFTNDSIINETILEIENLRIDSVESNPDVRMMIDIFSEGKTIYTICISNLRMSVNGSPIVYSTDFRHYIDEVLFLKILYPDETF